MATKLKIIDQSTDVVPAPAPASSMLTNRVTGTHVAWNPTKWTKNKVDEVEGPPFDPARARRPAKFGKPPQPVWGQASTETRPKSRRAALIRTPPSYLRRTAYRPNRRSKAMLEAPRFELKDLPQDHYRHLLQMEGLILAASRS